MNQKLEKAIEYIENWEIALFFEFLKSEVGDHEMISRLKNTFILGKTDVDFADQLRLLAGNLLGNNEIPETENWESFKEQLTAILQEKRHLGIVEILEKINKNLSYAQYDRTQWVSIHSKTSPISLEILSASLVEATKSLINSIQ